MQKDIFFGSLSTPPRENIAICIVFITINACNTSLHTHKNWTNVEDKKEG